jgi:NADH:ubiquinone oxidoreductase subunit 6 (subunit J)
MVSAIREFGRWFLGMCGAVLAGAIGVLIAFVVLMLYLRSG